MAEYSTWNTPTNEMNGEISKGEKLNFIFKIWSDVNNDHRNIKTAKIKTAFRKRKFKFEDREKYKN